MPVESVTVDTAATFKTMLLMSVATKDAYSEDRSAAKVQKRNNDGVPVWELNVAVSDERGRSEIIRVSCASEKSPADLVPLLTPVDFVGLRFGVARLTNGKSVPYFTADRVVAARPVEARG